MARAVSLAAYLLFVASACASPTPACPRAAPGVNPRERPADSDAASCTLFVKSAVGWTMKVAAFRPELVGGTPGERAEYLASKPDDPSTYGAFYACTGFAVTAKDAWCECPRAANRQFEDAEEADLKGHVVWLPK